MRISIRPSILRHTNYVATLNQLYFYHSDYNPQGAWAELAKFDLI